MKIIWIPQVIVTPMLIWAFNSDNPYGYYILLRWVCCAAFAYLTLLALARKKQGWVWVLGVTAVVYNPLLRIHLNREIWSVVNMITVVIVWSSAFVLKAELERKED